MKVLSDDQYNQVIRCLETLAVCKYEQERMEASKRMDASGVSFWGKKEEATQKLITSLTGL